MPYYSQDIGLTNGTVSTVSDDLWAMVLRGVDCSGYLTTRMRIKTTLPPAASTANNNETNQYFYHSDHLGSSSFVSDAIGYATQHLQYLPYGETFVDQHGAFDSRYKFSAKELDDETQYSYFGARYYDSDLSVWLSVDPMNDIYPSTSPYMYVLGNPVGLIDPNGMSAGKPDNIHIYENGNEDGKKVAVQPTTAPTNTYYYHHSNGTVENMGTYQKVGNKVNLSTSKYFVFNNAETMIETPYIDEIAAAALFGALMEYRKKSGDNNFRLEITQLQGKTGFHTNGDYSSPMADIRYVRKGGNTELVNGKINTGFTDASAEFDYNNSLLLREAFSNWGFSSILTCKSTNSADVVLPGTTPCVNHHDHMHLAGFSLSVGTYVPLSLSSFTRPRTSPGLLGVPK